MLVRGVSSGLAKLSRPRLARVHPRERLFRRLDECLEHPAVWVKGVAGAGKTTLTASYLDSRNQQAFWYQVDSGDRDPAVCCHYLQLAADRIMRQAGKLLPVLGPAQSADLGNFFRSFFAAFYDFIGSLCETRILVMDNTQEALDSTDFRKLLRVAIREAPKGISVIIASRSGPPADFVRLLANGDLAVLDPNELWFTEDESIAVQQLTAPACLTRSVEQMRKLHQKTCGWPAGLKLLLQVNEPEAQSVADGRDASETALFDYLATEVFDRQPENIRRILLEVAHLPRMTPAMASSLSATTDASRILESMYSDNLLTSLHGAGIQTCYEFHPLVRQFLLLRARCDLSGEERGRLMRRAAALLAQGGDLEASAQVLISGGHWDDLQCLLVEHASRLVDRGWHRTLAVWLDALPEGRVRSDPWLSYWQGAAQGPFDPPAGQRCFQEAYSLFRERRMSSGCYLAWSAVVDLICLDWADFSKLDNWLDEADCLRSEFGDPAHELVGRFSASMFGALLFRRPQDPMIHHWAQRLLSLIEACSDPCQRILLGCNLQIHYTVGVGSTVELDRLMKAIDPPPGTALVPLAETLLCAVKSMHHWIRGRSDQAAAAAESGSRLVRKNGLRMWDFLLGALQAYALLNSGEISRGGAAVAGLVKRLDPRRKIDLAHLHYLTCLASLSADDGPQALTHIEIANAIADRYGGPQQHALGRLAQAQALHAVRRTDEAWPVLEEGRQIGRSMESGILCFQADLCEALFALDTGDQERCARALKSAFVVGAERDYVNHNTFRPAVMARLCVFALVHGITPEYARRLIRLRCLKPPGVEVDCWPWPVRIYTLGRFTIAVEEKQVAEAGRLQHKPVELLQALIALGGRQIAIPRLIESLWPDAECKGGRGAFDANLLRLRRLLGYENAVLIEDGRVSLNDALCWVDVWQFERLLGKTEEDLLQTSRLVTDLLTPTTKLLRLYQGDFLEREECRPWLLSRREGLRNRLGNLLADIGSRLEVGEHWQQAVRLYQRAITVEPLAEPAYRRLMHCLHQHGETAEALRVYARCCEALRVGLRTTPSLETEMIRESIERKSRTNLPPNI